MFLCVLILILLLPLTFLPWALERLFSPDQLIEMGVRLERQQAEPIY